MCELSILSLLKQTRAVLIKLEKFVKTRYYGYKLHIAICDKLKGERIRVMKEHKGMKSQDVAILIFISEYCDGRYKVSQVAGSLKISQSEVSESINRSKIAKLIGSGNKNVFRHGLYEFLIYGLKFVFPVVPGHIVRGIPTSHSGPPLNTMISSSSDQFVWKHFKGTARGMLIEPLYKTIPEICSDFPEYYELLCLVDALRIGRSREVVLARDILKERLLGNGGK